MEFWRRHVPPRDPACSATTSPGLYHLVYRVGSCPYGTVRRYGLRPAATAGVFFFFYFLSCICTPLVVEISVISRPIVRCHLLSYA